MNIDNKLQKHLFISVPEEQSHKGLSKQLIVRLILHFVSITDLFEW